MNRVKLILRYLFGFITSILVSVIVILFIIKFVVLDKKYIKNVLEVNNYYSEVYEGTIEEMKNYMVSSGLEEEVLDNLFNENDMKLEVNNYIDSMYDGKDYIVNTDKIKNNLINNINSYLKKSNLDVTNRSELDLFVNDIVDIYSKEITFYNTFKYFNGFINKLVNNIDKVINISYIVLIVLVIVLFIIKSDFVGSSILTSGLILLFIRFVIYEKIDIKNIILITEYFSKSLKYILYRIGYLLLIIGILLIVLGLIIILIESLGKKKKNKLI